MRPRYSGGRPAIGHCCIIGMIASVLPWQYWFSDWKEKREQGIWWRRDRIGLYAPTLERNQDGKVEILDWPDTPDTNP